MSKELESHDIKVSDVFKGLGEVVLQQEQNAIKLTLAEQHCDKIKEKLSTLYLLLGIQTRSATIPEKLCPQEIVQKESKIFSQIIIDAFVEAVKKEFLETLNIKLPKPRGGETECEFLDIPSLYLFPIGVNGCKSYVLFNISAEIFNKFVQSNASLGAKLQATSLESIFFEFLMRIGLNAQEIESQIECYPFTKISDEKWKNEITSRLVFSTEYGQFDLVFF